MTQNVSGKLSEIKKYVRVWLFIGLAMIFFQIVIGGVTRLTDSGLSITEWAVIQGTLPPMGEAEWTAAFELYKVHAKKQFEDLHADMTLAGFKVIYFWEYFHRLWARLMGFVFLFPFLFFLFKKWLPGWLIRRLGVVILLAAMAAVAGWVMVKSGLNEDNRTWVSAYKLITHLGIGTALFCYMFWTCLKASQASVLIHAPKLRRFGWIVATVLMLQILFGGLMAGMRAGLIHPFWPFFVRGGQLLDVLGSLDSSGTGLMDYEASAAVKGVVQVLHRATAYLLSILIIWWVVQLKRLKNSRINKGAGLLISLLVTQFILGILTILNCIGRIPVGYAATHQAVALLLFASVLYLMYQLKKRNAHIVEKV